MAQRMEIPAMATGARSIAQRVEDSGYREVAHDDDPLEQAGQSGRDVPGGHGTVPERRMAGFILGRGRASSVVTASVAVNIEATHYQSTFVHELLARTGLPARKIYPDRDKVTRARTLAARYEAGKVFHLRTAPGLEAFEAEAVAFPNGRSDDLVDAAVYGLDLNRANDFHFASARW
jgi:hypothetical protein